MTLLTFTFVALGFALGHFFCPWVATVCKSLGCVDPANQHRKHQNHAIPYGGGIALLLSWLSITTVVSLGEVNDLWVELLSQQIDRSNLIFYDKPMVFSMGLLGIFILGLVDDISPLSPKIKLCIQMIISTWTVFIGDLQMSFFLEWNWLTSTITVFWLTLVINAFNLIDNMDGYCVLMAITILIFHALDHAINEHHLVAFSIFITLGPLCAFARFNLPPARMYLGDAGSLSIGYLIGTLSISSTYFHEEQTSASLFLPLVMLGVPLFDVATVMWRRHRDGAPLLVGDRRHFSHHLLDMGLTMSQVLLIVLCMAVITGSSSLLLMRVEDPWGWLILSQLLTFLFLIYHLCTQLKGRT